jgi:hypothetical protein
LKSFFCYLTDLVYHQNLLNDLAPRTRWQIFVVVATRAIYSGTHILTVMRSPFLYRRPARPLCAAPPPPTPISVEMASSNWSQGRMVSQPGYALAATASLFMVVFITISDACRLTYAENFVLQWDVGFFNMNAGTPFLLSKQIFLLIITQ